MNESRPSSLEELAVRCRACTACGLASTRTTWSSGWGYQTPRFSSWARAPVKTKTSQGEPFVGRGGQLLDKMLAAVGLSRQNNLYIANIVKCRPPKNRDPLPEEQDACIGWLKEQAALLRPKILVCLGRVAACRLIDPNFKVTREHGVFVEKNGMLRMGILPTRRPPAQPGAEASRFCRFSRPAGKNRGGLHPYRAGLPGGMTSLLWNDAGPFSDRFLRPPPYEDGAGFLAGLYPWADCSSSCG